MSLGRALGVRLGRVGDLLGRLEASLGRIGAILVCLGNSFLRGHLAPASNCVCTNRIGSAVRVSFAPSSLLLVYLADRHCRPLPSFPYHSIRCTQ